MERIVSISGNTVRLEWIYQPVFPQAVKPLIGEDMNTGMTLLTLTVIAAVLGLAKPAAAETSAKEQIITRAESRTRAEGSKEYFTGTKRVEMLFAPKHPDAPFSAAYVTFEPGARSHWHTHPAGQHLIVTDGVGLTGTSDGSVREFKAGDVLWCPKGVKHWHGASPTQAMTHLALTGTLPDGNNVQWMEAVTDEQYRKR